MRRLREDADAGERPRDYRNVREYMAGLKAALRTHQRLTNGTTLAVEVRDDARIPLAQRILLR